MLFQETMLQVSNVGESIDLVDVLNLFCILEFFFSFVDFSDKALRFSEQNGDAAQGN